MKIMDQNITTPNMSYKSLFKIGAIAALVAALVFRRNLDAE